jgi:uncharacterized protein YqjF (DUF2071 family)
MAVGRQRWNDLLFVHWPIRPQAIQDTLPPGLFVDTFEGDAYLGIVPFFMQRVRPTGLPPLPGISWFLELNVRTYVCDAAGNPGVWFYSLDCNQPLAVVIARRFFHLPYFHASMSAQRRGNIVDYRSRRHGAGAPASRFIWEQSSEGATTLPGSLDFFLLERYLLFTANRAGRLFQGRVHHAPYRAYKPAVSALSTEPAKGLGFNLGDPPASLLAALPVDVSIFPLSPIP